MLPDYYIKYNNKKVCLTDKVHFIEFDKHSGMVNTKSCERGDELSGFIKCDRFLD